MTRKKRWTDELLEELQKDLKTGEYYKTISAKYNIATGTLKQIVFLYDLQGRYPKRNRR